MNRSSHIIHPDVREDSWQFEKLDRIAIECRLTKKYADELRRANWWKAFLIRLKIRREAARIYRHRLYSSSKENLPN